MKQINQFFSEGESPTWKKTEQKNKKFVPTMIVAIPLPPRARISTAATTKTTPMSTTITTTFKIPLHQINQHIYLKMTPPSPWPQSVNCRTQKGTTLVLEDSMIDELIETMLSINRQVKVCFLPGRKTRSDVPPNTIP